MYIAIFSHSKLRNEWKTYANLKYNFKRNESARRKNNFLSSLGNLDAHKVRKDIELALLFTFDERF